jgi:tRNA pseudouridine55 synthase
MTGADTSTGGILLLDKPTGISSFQALRPLKRLFPKTKIGHAGTLDPAASGLLLIGIGSATRLLEYMEGMPKTYSFQARFGLVSDSYDMEGDVEAFAGSVAACDLDAARIEAALEPFRGPIRQTPPVYSAIKIDGERACDRVRAGETVTLTAREVTVHALRLISYNAESSIAAFEMTCSKGTYVRSLVHDLGQALGCGAVTDSIRRLAIGPFRVEAAVTAEALIPGLALLPLETAVAHLPQAIVPAEWVARFLNGQAVPVDLPPSGPEQDYRALDADARLLAIATLSPQGQLCPRKVLAKV